MIQVKEEVQPLWYTVHRRSLHLALELGPLPALPPADVWLHVVHVHDQSDHDAKANEGNHFNASHEPERHQRSSGSSRSPTRQNRVP